MALFSDANYEIALFSRSRLLWFMAIIAAATAPEPCPSTPFTSADVDSSPPPGSRKIDLQAVGGEAGATSSLGRDYLPAEAFTGRAGDYWESNDFSARGERVWFRFNEPQVVVSFSFGSAQSYDSSAAEDGPNKFAFYASAADDCEDTTKHETLFEYEGGKRFSSKTQDRMHNIDNEKPYICYGLRIDDVPGECDGLGLGASKMASVSRIQFWTVDINWISRDKQDNNSEGSNWSSSSESRLELSAFGGAIGVLCCALTLLVIANICLVKKQNRIQRKQQIWSTSQNENLARNITKNPVEIMKDPMADSWKTPEDEEKLIN